MARDHLRKATARRHEVQEQLNKVRVPIEQSRVEVLHRTMALAEREYAMRRQELRSKQEIKQGDIDAIGFELAKLEFERQQALIRAPMDGVVTAGDVKVGDVLERGKPVVEIVAQHGFRFEATVPSENVSHLWVGMPARVKFDAADYQRYGMMSGTVVFISPDSDVPAGQFNASYLVKIQFEAEELAREERRGRIKLGMAGQVELVTGQERLLMLLVKQLRQTISLG